MALTCRVEEPSTASIRDVHRASGHFAKCLELYSLPSAALFNAMVFARLELGGESGIVAKRSSAQGNSHTASIPVGECQDDTVDSRTENGMSCDE